MKPTAIQILTSLGRVEEAAKVLLTLARNRSPGIRKRQNAVQDLAHMGCTRALLTLAQDEHTEAWLRLDAAEAPARPEQANRAAEILLAMDQSSRNQAHVIAARAPAKPGRINEAAETFPAITRDESPEARDRPEATRNLIRPGQAEEAAAVLWALAQDKHAEPRIRPGAARNMAHTGQAGTDMKAFQALLGPKWPEKIIRETIRALVQLGGARAGEAIRIAVQNGNQRVALWLAEAFQEAPEGLRDVPLEDILKLVTSFPAAGKEIIEAASRLDPPPDWLAAAATITAAA